MNLSSIRFRLAAWHTLLFAGLFLILGSALYLEARHHLASILLQTQARRARQIGETLVSGGGGAADAKMGLQIELLYAPERSDRFFRVVNAAGTVVYCSRDPNDQSFSPEKVPALPAGFTSGILTCTDGRDLLMAAETVASGPGAGYRVEVGTSAAPLESFTDRLLLLLAIGIPVTVAGIWGGGYLLVRTALKPVAEIAGKAEVISLQNLTERLPIAKTGDELQRVSESLNRMIARLDDSFANSRRFVADASHELRTPLTIIRGELEGMARDPSETAVTQERAASLLEEVERLSRIVDQLFALSRLDAGEATSEWVAADLSSLVSTTADQMSLLAADKAIILSQSMSPGVFVKGDRARLKQIVVNLLDNAIKYTPAGGTVHLAVRPDADRAVFEISDSGIGIPPEDLPHVFKRFYRSATARTERTDGAGLGLAIVQSIAAAHGGVATVQSTPGQGSVFQVTLPLASPI